MRFAVHVRQGALIVGRTLATPVVAAMTLHATQAAQATPPAQVAAQGRHTLMHQGLERRYVVRLPLLARAQGKPLPLVLVLHGGGGNAANAETMTGFTAKARDEGFIVVYPEGTGRAGRRGQHLLTWNAGHCCGPAMAAGVDDVGFIRALIEQLQADLPVDARRIYATGLSNGGMMAHRLGIELSDRLAAIAPVVATVFGDEAAPAQAVSALTINGALDTSVPLAGGAPGGRFASAWDGTPTLPAEAQGRFWAAANGCQPAPDTVTQGEVSRWSYRCPAGRAVERLVVSDNGHAWPGGQAGSRLGDTPSTALNATTAIWWFFAAHPRPD
jgi:polyhydroxybutyrate depolymerase